MEDTIIELARQVPALVIFGYVALRGMQFLRDERDSRSKVEEARLDTLKSINDECHQHAEHITKRCETAFDKNNEVIQENTRALGQIKVALDAVIDRVECS